MRIIAGSARGRSFEAPQGMDTRPTLDRVKEAIFGMVQFAIPQSTVLDLFSGSGNLGLEAASRGAARVVCNDQSRNCVKIIQKNADSLGLSSVMTVLQMDYTAAIDWFCLGGMKADVAFLDAPYADGTAQKAAELLFKRDCICADGVVILEHAWNLPPHGAPGLMRIEKTRKYGACGVSVLMRDGEEEG